MVTPQKAPVKCVESGHFWGPRLWQARLHQAIIDQYLDQLSQVAPGGGFANHDGFPAVKRVL